MSRASSRSIQGVSALEWLQGVAQQPDVSLPRRRRSLATDAADAEESGNYTGEYDGRFEEEEITPSQNEQRLAALERNQELILAVLQGAGLLGGKSAAAPSIEGE